MHSWGEQLDPVLVTWCPLLSCTPRLHAGWDSAGRCSAPSLGRWGPEEVHQPAQTGESHPGVCPACGPQCPFRLPGGFLSLGEGRVLRLCGRPPHFDAVPGASVQEVSTEPLGCLGGHICVLGKPRRQGQPWGHTSAARLGDGKEAEVIHTLGRPWPVMQKD